MAVRIGKDNTIQIKKDVLVEIFQKMKQYNYETGGIIGVNERGVITTFQFDKTHSFSPFEYCPNVDFLNHVINGKWANENIEFVGFVHSHLHNSEISQQDIDYAKQILKANKSLNNILIGIVDLSKTVDDLKWNSVYLKELKQIKKTNIIHIEEELE